MRLVYPRLRGGWIENTVVMYFLIQLVYRRPLTSPFNAL